MDKNIDLIDRKEKVLKSKTQTNCYTDMDNDG